MDEIEYGTAWDALDAIRRGGTQLVMVATQRLEQALEELARGNFTEAYSRLNEAESRIVPLVQAQNHIAFADGATVKRVCDLEVGDVLKEMGTVTEITEGECGNPACREIQLDDRPKALHWHGKFEVYIEPDDDTHDDDDDESAA